MLRKQLLSQQQQHGWNTRVHCWARGLLLLLRRCPTSFNSANPVRSRKKPASKRIFPKQYLRAERITSEPREFRRTIRYRRPLLSRAYLRSLESEQEREERYWCCGSLAGLYFRLPRLLEPKLAYGKTVLWPGGNMPGSAQIAWWRRRHRIVCSWQREFRWVDALIHPRVVVRPVTIPKGDWHTGHSSPSPFLFHLS